MRVRIGGSHNDRGSQTAEIPEIAVLDQDPIEQRLPKNYYDYLDVFDKAKADVLPPHMPYDHRLEFVEDVDKSRLPRSRIYPTLSRAPRKKSSLRRLFSETII